MKRKSLLLMTLLAMLLAPFAANAQSTYSWGSTSDNDGSSQYANPFGRYYGWEYRVFLYPANTMNFNGRITQLEFLADDDLDAGGELDIWMKETTLTDLDNNVTFAQYQANATLVYHSASSPAFSQDTYVAIPLQTPFMHDQSKNILIMVRSVANGSTGDGDHLFYKKNPGSSGYLTWLGCKDSEDADPSDNSSFDYIDVTNEDLPVIRWTYGSTPSGCDFYEDFEGITNPSTAHGTEGPLPDGWDYNYGGSAATRPHVQNATSYPGLPSTGNYLCLHAGATGTYDNNSYAIMPAFEAQMAPSHISFKYKFENTSNGRLSYGVITGTDINTYSEKGYVSSPSSNPGTVSVNLSTSETLGKRIAFKWTYSSSWYTVGIDDICVELTRVESVPTNLAASNITPNSADISWNGNSDSYTVWYGGYEAQTLLNEGFDNNGTSLPSGWTSESSVGSGSWTISNTEGYHSPEYSAYCGHSNRLDETYLISPSINLSNASSATLKFFMKNRNWGASDIEECHVYYRVNGGSWNELWSTTQEKSWEEITVNLTGLAANYQIGFKCVDHYGHGLCIDDVTVSAQVPFGIETTVVAPPTTLTGLHPNTTYTVKVKGENTAYCEPITFTTLPCTLTVACSPTAGGTATASAAGPFNEGDQVTLTATPAEGYIFTYWTKSGTGATFSSQYDNPVTLTIGTANVTATARFVAVTEFEVGTNGGTTNGGYLPTDTYYNYSLTQQIYYPEEIGHTGTIQSISFYHGSSISDTRNLDIYLSMAGPSDYPSSDYSYTAPGTKVFSGNVTFTQGWNTIVFTTTFNYNNIDNNLMITVDDNTGVYSSTPAFATFSCDKYCSLYYYDDNNNLDPASPASNPTGVIQYKNYIKLGMTTSTVKDCYKVTAVANPTSAGHIEEMQIGTGTSTSSYVPFYSGASYSFVEQIYTANAIGGAGTINSISFYLGSSYSSAQTNDIVLYMKQVRRGGFADASDYEPVTSSDIVYNGQWTIPANHTGWVTIELSTPFAYDGTSNLLVAIDENTSGYSSRSFRYTSVSNSVYRANGSSDPDPADLDSFTGTKTVSNYLPHIKFDIAYPNSGSSRMYANGASCTVYAKSDGADIFANWTESGTEASANNPYTFTVNADHNLVATFAPMTLSIGTDPADPTCLDDDTEVTLMATSNFHPTLDQYVFSTGVDASKWYTLTNTTSLITSDGDSKASTLQEIGFNFPFGGGVYNQFSVNSDGNLRLGPTVTGTGSYSDPFSSSNANENSPKINGMGFDGYYTSSYSNYVRAQVFGEAPNRVLVVEYKLSPYSSSYRQNTWNWQVQLYENGAVQLVYGPTAPGSYNYTNQIGMCVASTDGWTISTTEHTPTHFTSGTSTTNSSANSWPGVNRYYRFDPFACTWTANGTAGTANGSSYTVTPTANSTYTVSATLNGSTMTANASVTLAPAAPTNLQVSNIGASTATATWDANGASNWEYSYDGGSHWSTTNTNTVDLNDLTPGTTYTFQVRSYSGDCDSETVSVEFTTENTHTVTVSANPAAGGSVSQSGNGTYNHGASCTVQATPAEADGYHFVNWTEDGNVVSTNASYTFTVNDNHNLVANFELNQYTVTATINPAGAGTFSHMGSGTSYSGTFDYGEMLIIQADANPGWTFVKWTKSDGTDYPTSEYCTYNLLTWRVNEDLDLVANFVYTFTLDITGHQGGNGNWYLISSPLDGTIAPTDVANMVATPAENYDLFSFKQDAPVDPETGQGLEWINYKETAENGGGFGLVAGQGYLYANYNTVQLQFTGVPYQGDGQVPLTNTTGFNWSGWNLVGNPYNQNAQADVRFYAMNSSGTEIVAAQGYGIGPLEGIFVQYGDYTEVNFSPTGSKKSASLALNVTQGRGLVDRAIVDFENGGTLAKFQLNPSHTKIYIPKEDKDYAVVMAESDMGEMPVNFKAEKNGTYTFSVNAEDVAFGYLHLIDNLTGADVDLLVNPSYSFNAATTDYASRFRLVFATANSDDDNFGFYNGSAWVINNDGEAVLQVVDVMGRILKSESISGCATVNFSAAPGVYMLRLINGDNERVQKVVVR